MKRNKLSLRVLKSLDNASVELNSLKSMSAKELLSIKGIGPVALVEIQQWLTVVDDTVRYSNAFNAQRKSELTSYISDVAEAILIGNTIETAFEARLKTTRLDSLAGVSELHKVGVTSIPETAVDEDTFKASIADYGDKQRKMLWIYRRAAIRIVLLGTVLSKKLNSKKFSYRLNESMKAIVGVVLGAGTNEVTLSQIVHRVSPIATVDQYLTKEGEVRASNAWINDELALQFVSELAELNYLDFSIRQKTHKVSLSSKVTKDIDEETFREFSLSAKFLSQGTIMLDVPIRPKQLLSQSSWWYKTPQLSPDQLEFVEVVNSIRYGFKPEAENMIEAAFRKHLKEPKPVGCGWTKTADQDNTWAEEALVEFKRQIRASNANGFHYIGGKADSVWRWYYGATIGHLQTSKAIRNLTTYVDIPNPVKYDFRNNVVQLYTLLTGIRALGNYVGLTPEVDQLGDLRNLLAAELNDEVAIVTGEVSTIFNKTNIKPLFMVWAYNGGKRLLMEGVFTSKHDFLRNLDTKDIKVPGFIDLVGEDMSEAIWDRWEKALNKLVPGIIGLKQVFRRLLKANPLTEASFTYPDGGIGQYASVQSIDEPLHWVDSKYRLHTHTHYRKEIVAGEKNTGVLPRVNQGFDAYVMRQLVIRAKRLGIVVVPNHDAFVFDESHKETIFGLVVDIFDELRESQALADIVDELNVAKVDLTIRNSKGLPVTMGDFGDQLTRDDIVHGTPMDTEEL